MTAFVAFIAQHWRLSLGLAIAVVNLAVIEYWKHEAHEEGELIQKYQAAAKAQDVLTKQIIATHEQLQEAKDAQAKVLALQRDDALARMRAAELANASRSFLPATSPGTSSGNRICFAADQLDRGIRDSIARASQRFASIAGIGQQGVDTAIVCRDWERAR